MFTLSDCITRINQILNYPSITYTDISHFFDQAISELNTSLKIGLPLFSQMVDENRINIYEQSNLTLLENLPSGAATEIPSGTKSEFTDTDKIYYCTDDYRFYKYDKYAQQWVAYKNMYGIYIDDNQNRTVYTTMQLPTAGYAIWTPVVEDRLNDFDLNNYLPNDWLILCIIPYVCFKTTVRDGGNGALYSEEFVQGFQQLQTSYDVPNFVELSTVAHLPAYRPLVKENIAALNKKVPTRAIYDSMKVGNAIMPTYGGFNSRGGWGF
jgi:hypothetical protein